jgi:hypothetical protein
MQTKTITVTEAIKELSILDDRILKASSKPMAIVKRIDGTTLYPTGVSVSSEDLKANFQSYIDLLTYRDALREAVLNSNNSTKLNGFNMTPAAAIDKKNRSQSLRNYMFKITQSVQNAISAKEQAENVLNDQLSAVISSIMASKESVSSAVEKAKEQVESRYTSELIIPKSVQEYVDHCMEDLDNFITNIDVALNLHNAQTTITVEW